MAMASAHEMMAMMGKADATVSIEDHPPVEAMVAKVVEVDRMAVEVVEKIEAEVA
jgi:hypothetical protein